MYACLHIGIFSIFVWLSLCIRAARVYGKNCVWQLLATVENITNVKILPGFVY